MAFRILALCLAFCAAGEGKLLELPPGVTELDRPLVVEAAEDATENGVQIRGAAAGSTLKASARFVGEALIVARNINDLSIERLTLDGNRAALERPFPIAPYDKAFVDFYPLNGILVEGGVGLIIRDVTVRQVVNFALLVARTENVRLQQLRIEHCGSRDTAGKNNTTGGILLEEGVKNFEVRFSKFRAIRGNALWTHSRMESPRNRDGWIQENDFNGVGRDAVQIGHATNVRVVLNTMANIGYPVEIVDMANGGIPVGIDTAGNVDKSIYTENLMLEVNGKCFDLDGFHHGEVTRNRCVNRKAGKDYPHGHFGIVLNNTNPDMRSEAVLIENNEIEGMKYGGIFLIGRGHTVRKNRMRWLNLAGCTESHSPTVGCYFLPNEDGMLRSGIYLGKGAERPDPAEDNVVEDNLITGHKMQERCVGFSPAVDPARQRVARNVCLEVDVRERGKVRERKP
ncbi:MAG: right-handed parallel beta-helix repeat-containing protein [Bryobacter sp.]|nr:right-handed parallel beta-helix repeat-containing protein [Bryobacter sp.]